VTPHVPAGNGAAAWGLTLSPVVAAAGLYLWGRLRLSRSGIGWPAGRTWAALAGSACVAAALAPPLADRDGYFPAHVVGHLLLAMLAPLLLALSAPVTLALRALPRGSGWAGAPRTLLLGALHSRSARVLTWPVTVVVLEVGSLYALYLGPLFGWMHEQPWLHLFVHAHMFLSGCLLSWLLVGPDPLPHRPSTRARVLVLLLVAGSHDVLAKVMYAVALPAAGPVEQVRLGAQWLFYGGDLVELLLAVALMTAWYRRTGRRVAHERRRAPAPVAVRAGRA
jgi:putative membrane protein